MEASLTSKEVQEWIKKNYKKDIPSLILKGSPFNKIPVQELADQLQSRKKSEKKLPTWFSTNNIIYPKSLSIEQTSSEQTAKYKASLIGGNSLLDLTMGFGVDTFYFSKSVNQLIAIERQLHLAEKVSHNFKIFGVNNVSIENTSSEEYLANTKQTFDWIYLDPARRDENKNKVFKLSDCEPNVIELKNDLFKRSNNVMVKTSPMLDITQGIIELEDVTEVHVVCLNNEVKELLWILSKKYQSKAPIFKIVELKEGNNFISEYKPSNDSIDLTFSEPLEYIYQPHVGFLKAGLSDFTATENSLNKIEVNTHLYTSKSFIKNYKGRIFKVKHIALFNKKEVKKQYSHKQYTVVSKNFPLQSEELKKTFKIKEGKDDCLLFFRGQKNKKYVVEAKRVY